MRKEHSRVLVLNADCTPIGLISWKRAITLVLMNQENPSIGLMPMDYFDSCIVSANGQRYPVPAVVRSSVFIKRARNGIPFSRKNIYLRDKMTCQYCGYCDGTGSDLTFDHVIPRAVWKKNGYKGTPTKWTNIVTCCEVCNKKKADRPPKAAGLHLLKEPKEPNPNQFILGLSPWCKIHPQWEPYITPMYKYLMDNRNARDV